MPDESDRAEGSTAAALDIRSLRKEFGSAVALDGISLAVPYGSIFGFLGPNGAGKTTTIRIITGLAHPTAGTVRVLGRDRHASRRRSRARSASSPTCRASTPG